MSDKKILLSEKVDKEHSEFYEELEKSSVSEVIKRSYEKVFKDDIVIALESVELSDEQLDNLLSRNNTLHELYESWLEEDVSYMDRLIETIEEESNYHG